MLKDFIRKKQEQRAVRRPDFSRIKTGVNEGSADNAQSRDTDAAKINAQPAFVPEVPDNVYRKCNYCKKAILNADVRNNLYRCPRCGGYFRVHARRRIELLADEGSFKELNAVQPFVNPLNFPNYEAKVRASQEKFGLDEAVVSGVCSIAGERAVLCVCDGRFIMSSMGHNVGEKITEAVELATKEKLPVIIYCCSGGARMQEGIVSLMQMAKTSAALRAHHEAGLLYVSVLTNPTTGGVTASFAMLGDVILAEPKALIGFAGPRVIEQTIGQKLPEGFQTSEFLLEHGFVDAIAGREEQKELLARLIRMHDKTVLTDGTKALKSFAESGQAEVQKKGAEKMLSAWERVQLSRDAKRPKALDYIERIFDSFTELHGDRCYGDDGAIVGGLAELFGMPVTVIAEQKGRSMRENLQRNFGMPSPEGYRKALRLMREADDFGRSIICFVDTPGAYPGIESEERGQGEAIARCLYELSGVKVPVLSLVISEGGSGGALALAVANEVWMMENAVYSILSPEGFASILYKDAKKAKEAAELMKLTAEDLLSLKVIDRIIPEEEPCVSMKSLDALCRDLKRDMAGFLVREAALSAEEIRTERNLRYRGI
ncbi:MAG: acetyl-CoA carboxylase carboxyltransferase subunit alpha [Eubacteriales bacterium]|nr:acetyl-CoA carboxylase carboxyltransferase subunit alpha [Eubacteriales bacterium]